MNNQIAKESLREAIRLFLTSSLLGRLRLEDLSSIEKIALECLTPFSLPLSRFSN